MKCHFTDMEHCAGDCDGTGKFEEWFECKHCGCVKEMQGRVVDPETGRLRPTNRPLDETENEETRNT